jgi:hypothetical protein
MTSVERRASPPRCAQIAEEQAQWTGSLRALEISLSTETNRRLDEIWPGPGGEAPQAYAW